MTNKEPIKIGTLYAICILAVTGLIALILETTGGSWSGAIVAFVQGSLTNPSSWGQTLTFMVPLALVALGAILSFEAGQINIGQEGQLIVGGATATFVGVHLEGPGGVVLILILLAGFLAGAIWAFIAALLKFLRGVPEVLTTLLLVAVAFQVAGYGLKKTNLLADPNAQAGSRSLSSPELADDFRLGEITIFGNTISVGIFIMLSLAVLIWLVMNKMVIGFKLRTLAQNPVVAHRAGISKALYGSTALLFSGGMAGLAGAVILTSGLTDWTFIPGFSLSLGWTGLLVALISRNKAWLVVLVAILFAGLHTGSQVLAATGVDRQIGNITTALIALALLIPPAIIYFRSQKSQQSQEKEKNYAT